jgi:threonine synthase
MNSVDPLRIEGYKLSGFEIFLQLKNEAPSFIFIPVSSGGHLIGLIRAFLDLKQEGWIQNFPTFVGVQARGCSPITRPYASGKSKVKRIRKAETIAHSISNPDPPGGNILLKLMRETNGMMLDVSDREILKAQKMLAGLEGIFCEPASATTLAGLLSGKVKVSSNDQVVLVITGSGLKTMDSVKTQKINLSKASLSTLDKTIASFFK